MYPSTPELGVRAGGELSCDDVRAGRRHAMSPGERSPAGSSPQQLSNLRATETQREERTEILTLAWEVLLSLLSLEAPPGHQLGGPCDTAYLVLWSHWRKFTDNPRRPQVKIEHVGYLRVRRYQQGRVQQQLPRNGSAVHISRQQRSPSIKGHKQWLALLWQLRRVETSFAFLYL
ncbi:hypothetical protein SKAU_G00405680 [Synaphobranchus kaupii]|uniref:Uncharacterized protein n=1 Tax=Synaphobranchus kaupii TaxID=118154 RepID=A0A9Q1E9X2_SYNKA|nr:hypothetical protein SKAU_G00405680 [Synaphobranchus kaupii]